MGIFNGGGTGGGSGAVSSVFTRTGAVTATAGDYTGVAVGGTADALAALALTDAMVKANAAIAKTKLASLDVVNADVNNAAAIAYSKLNLGTSIVNADVSTSAAIALSKLAATGYLGYVKVTDTQAANTAGGTFTTGAYRTRVLNTKDSDTNGDCSLASNQMTLTAGTYQCLITAPAIFVNSHKARLRNVTDSATLLIGTSEYGDAASGVVMTPSRICGRFTIAASKALEVQHACQTTRSANGFGVAANLTESEVYTVVELWRVS